MVEHSIRSECRLCGSVDLRDALSLAPTPLANAFVPSQAAAHDQRRYPLTLRLCGDCGHLQLVDVIDPEVLFRDYVYVSGTSPSFVAHFEQYAESVSSRLGLGGDDLVVDIGSNDGTFLRPFQQRGFRVLGVDPAEKIAASATEAGIPTLCAFFNSSQAQTIRQQHGAARVISANNVFAHIDDLAGVVEGVRELLDDTGLFVFEVSYLVSVFEGTLFDTIYHEHLDYHRVGPLRRFFRRFGMTLVDIERVNTHGGSLRGYARIGDLPVSDAVVEAESTEIGLGLDDVQTYHRFQNRIDRTGNELSALLNGLAADGKTIAAYGAPAKATTLMHQFGLDDRLIRYVIDDSPLKQNLFTPGLGIPVVSSEILKTDPPDYLVLLAWNFADPIIQKSRDYTETGGRFIVPLPNLQVREN